jgi:hypothetical protein
MTCPRQERSAVIKIDVTISSGQSVNAGRKSAKWPLFFWGASARNAAIIDVPKHLNFIIKRKPEKISAFRRVGIREVGNELSENWINAFCYARIAIEKNMQFARG